jgi:hypothetical protein
MRSGDLLLAVCLLNEAAAGTVAAGTAAWITFTLLGGRAVSYGHAVLLGFPAASSAVAVRRRRGCLTHSWQHPLGGHGLTL